MTIPTVYTQGLVMGALPSASGVGGTTIFSAEAGRGSGGGATSPPHPGQPSATAVQAAQAALQAAGERAAALAAGT
jgi:hypothetical protein